MSIRFPKDFVWGAATSSFQIEGATHTDDRGESIWDRFCTQKGAIADGTDGQVACDHYNRWPQDLELMSRLNLQAYRFSIAWPRIQPTGRGNVVQAGLDFYSKLVDGLLARGITPWVTLYHWDLPQSLQDEHGGWVGRDTAKHFAEYADIVSRHLGDRVKHWITHNEPWCASVLGHLNGEHAPGLKDPYAHLASSHHILYSHGLAMQALRANMNDAECGITVNLVPAIPASPSDADAAATTHFDGWFNRWYLDPISGRGYPADLRADYLKRNYVDAWDFVRPGDMQVMAAKNDFLGINFYNRAIIRSDRIPEAENAPRTQFPNEEHTDMGWEVDGPSLGDILERVHRDYEFPAIYVTENGAAYPTAPDAKKQIKDVKRRAYFEAHLSAAHRAIENGVPLKGYFAWSLLDNFEWAYGYEKRFGLVWVDYETQERIPKDSAHWYAKVIEDGGF